MKLSIIIPCYNCEKTLREAVDSCYRQNLQDNKFEIMMVDDGSSDGSWSLMQQIATEHGNIKLIQHEKNRGGGAARNTGIKASQGEIIYCLDSDNFFADDSVKTMLEFLEQQELDGVAFYERRFFQNKNPKKFSRKINAVIDRRVTLDDLFNLNSVIMLDNFFYRRDAYNKTPGYPEHHGFDTQSFEIAFLAKQLSVMVCPNSIFYHRQGQAGQRSYFEREYEKGLFSVNTLLSIEPILNELDDGLISQIQNYPIFKKNHLTSQGNLKCLIDEYTTTSGNLLENPNKERNEASRLFITIIQLLLSEKYRDSLIVLSELSRKKQTSDDVLLFLQLRIFFGLRGTPKNQIIDVLTEYLHNHNILEKRKAYHIPALLHPLLKILNALRK